MPHASPYPYRHIPFHAWAPMTDAEWDALAPHVVPDRARGGRPADHRRTWDAIFWVALTRLPWRALPPQLGTPEAAHRALRRAARAGTLETLMACVSADRRVHRAELMPLAHRILRAMRRAFRQVTMRALLLARALGLWTALPCAPWHLPKPGLSEKLRPLVAQFRDPATRASGLLARIHAAFLDHAGDLRRWTAR